MKKIKSSGAPAIKFTSTVFPAQEDMELWESLTPEQRKAVEIRDIKEGYGSGLAEPCKMADVIAKAEVKKKLNVPPPARAVSEKRFSYMLGRASEHTGRL